VRFALTCRGIGGYLRRSVGTESKGSAPPGFGVPGMTTEAPRARILTVEDEAAMRSALTAVLGAEGYEVRAEADGSAIAAVAGDFRPDLAILDVQLPVGPDGYDIARRLRETSDLPVIFLTCGGGYGARRAGFEAGGDDYLVKPFPMEELLWRVGALLRRCARLSSAVREIGDLTLDEGARRALRAGEVLELTETEHRLLSVLAGQSGQVLSKDKLLAEVWGYGEYDPNLVEVHVSSLRKKLEAHGPRLIHTVTGAGYVVRA